MDKFEIVGYTCLGLVAVLYIAVMVIGMIAVLPFGIIGLVVVTGVGALLIKVLKERLANKEDDYYARNVEK